MNKKSKPSITRKILNAVRNTAVRNVDMASMMGIFEGQVPEKLRKDHGNNKIRKGLAFILSVMLVLGLSVTASAEVTHTITDSVAGTSNSWVSEPVKNLTYSSIYNHVCGGDVGIWFFVANIGLQASFVQSTNRIVYFEQYEKDGNSQVKCKDYRAYFGMNGSYYRPVSYSNTWTNSATIEDDGTVELYFKYWVCAVSGDSSSAIPQGFFRYTHWTY